MTKPRPAAANPLVAGVVLLLLVVVVAAWARVAKLEVRNVGFVGTREAVDARLQSGRARGRTPLAWRCQHAASQPAMAARPIVPTKGASLPSEGAALGRWVARAGEVS